MASIKPSSRARIVIFAILMPAAVAATDQLLFEQLRTHPRLSPCLYPWMVFTTGVLSWSIGRYLSPGALRCLVFGWALALLNLLTMAACLSGPVSSQFAYVLVSAQIGLLTIWSILAVAPWQWRLPAALVAVAGVVTFSGSFMHWWNARSWNVLMVLTALIVALICIGLRLRGFSIRAHTISIEDAPTAGLAQFGTKHLLVWATAIVPVLLVARGMDLISIRVLREGGVLSAGLVAASLAAADLIAISAALGSRGTVWRLTALFVVPPVFGLLFEAYTRYLYSTYRFLWSSPPLIHFLIEMHGNWLMWFGLSTAMLAALLLFLRGQGYRLERRPDSR
jgi:hypothetical protein